MVTAFITRAGMGFCVRPYRYALALAIGSALGADVFALHECDNPFLGDFSVLDGLTCDPPAVSGAVSLASQLAAWQGL
jgi:hypothetical protein